MRGLVETLVFGGVALTLHLVAWPADHEAGASSAGGGGADLATLSAASAAVARAVAEWDRPPASAIETPQTLAAPDMPDTAPPAPMPDLMAAPPRAPALAPAPALADRPPRPEQPPRPPRPAVKQPAPDTPRPAPRPDRKPNVPRVEPPQRQADPAPMSSPASAAQVARRAAGEGGSARGKADKAQSATLSPARTRSLMAEWGGQIRTRIARAVPRGAGTGTAVVRLTVSADGGLVSVAMAKSSGNPRIDALALEAVRRAGRFPAAPAQLGVTRQSFTLPVQSR
ncbi:cell envelope integrity protein TolA [Rhodovulum marinum]|uniref:Outer membrane transport energization protein TonB n=1 Tax=Rhodovulum marinum TaxID=320662 RepID=A0A4R2Q5R1_9RHOB|nr:energy transducer TonB [Rhodovulum marinum]TCP44142.1 outer membrane transport energization protein TonB [Rhodovulum marinum]